MANLSRILPACGFAVGVALVLATSAFKEQSKDKNDDPMYTFQYNPPGGTDYSVTSVEDTSNWSYAPDASCITGVAKACSLQASVDNVDATDPDHPVLLSSEDIQAVLNTPTNTARVSSTADGQFINRTN